MVQEESLIYYSIPKYEGRYMINRVGDVYSELTGKVLSPNIHYISGYKSVQLTGEDGVKRFNIHKLMCTTFIDKDYLSKGLVCNHKDGVKSNNYIENLEVVTISENGKHAYRLGLNSYTPILGEDHGMSKLNEFKVAQIYLLYKQADITQQKLADMYGVKRATISDITRGKSWSHVTKRL